MAGAVTAKEEDGKSGGETLGLPIREVETDFEENESPPTALSDFLRLLRVLQRSGR